MHAMAMLWSNALAPPCAPSLQEIEPETSQWRGFGARVDSATIAHVDPRVTNLVGLSALLACSAGDGPHILGAASRCAVAFTGRLDNEATLRRRLIASGSVSANASVSSLVRRLFEIYLAQHRDGQSLVEAVSAHLRGDYALIALAPTSQGPLMAGLQRGAPLWLYRSDDVVRLSTKRIASVRSDAQRLEPGDLVLTHPDRIAIVDTDGMRIERRLSAIAHAHDLRETLRHASA